MEKNIQEDDGSLAFSVLVEESLATVLCYATVKYCFNTLQKYACCVDKRREMPTYTLGQSKVASKVFIQWLRGPSATPDAYHKHILSELRTLAI